MTILSRVASDEDLAVTFGSSATEVAARLADARERLLARRAERPQPARDDKALAAWNGLAIAAFADAAVALAATDPDAAAGYRDAAERAAGTIVDGLLAARRLARPVVEGRPGGRERRARGLHASGRWPACTLRGDVRRALVRDRPGPDGSRARALRRPGRRLLRYRRRPRAPGDPAEGRPGQRRPVGQRDGGPGPAPARGLDRRGGVPRCRRAGACGRSCRS